MHGGNHSFTVLLQVSPDGKQFSVTSPDRRIRVFWYRTGKLRRVYDESLEVILNYGEIFVIPLMLDISDLFNPSLIRLPKIYNEVMHLYTDWKQLILGGEWLLRRKLRRQKVLHNQMLFLMRALIFSSMRLFLE